MAFGRCTRDRETRAVVPGAAERCCAVPIASSSAWGLVAEPGMLPVPNVLLSFPAVSGPLLTARLRFIKVGTRPKVVPW